ncbi:thioredoxin TrxA [Sedimentibacter saalensis]|uniref:thioredoxin TrxA n=1 Tax=Sedimentibacter saalensis TaxID=130788 RepID=UPI0028A1C627|nr:thioredoxin domain-containing protein [Sedimentibacter saalensis]
MLMLDKTNFETEVLQSKGYVLVDFFGDGCAPCEALMPHVMELSEKYKEQLKFAKLNTTKARRVAIGQKILGLPVISIYKDGEKIEELIKDEATPENIEALIKKYI